jgi:hypothetical protein
MKIIGGPMPALYPYMLKGLFENDQYLERVKFTHMASNYTVLPDWQNILHELAHFGRGKLLNEIFESGKTKYLACRSTPLSMASPLSLC